MVVDPQGSKVSAYWRGFGYSRVAELRERLTAVDDR
jgi:hypothetical protein